MPHIDSQQSTPVAKALLCLLIVLATCSVSLPANAQAVIWQQFLYGASGVALDTLAYSSMRALPAVDSNGNPVIAGKVYIGPSSQEWHVLKLSAIDGTELWRYRLADTYVAAGHALVDADDNVFALGSFSGGAKLLKLDGATGAVIWQQDFNRSTYPSGPAGAHDVGGHLLLDRLGSVYISTTSFRPTIGYTSVVAKFDADTGAPIWDKDFGTIWSGGGPMVADTTGDVFITSSYLDAPNATNWETRKLSRIDGTTLWRKTFDGTAHYYDYPESVGIDATGNVFVTGNTNQPPNGTTLSVTTSKTIKYAGIDGGILWETQYATFKYTSQLKIDSAGDVIVVGTTDTAAGNVVAKVMKHAGETGAILWESSNGTLSNDSSGTNTVAIDANGQIVTAGWQSGFGYDLVFRRFNAATGARTGEMSYGRAYGDPFGGISVAGTYSFLLSIGRDAAQLATGTVIKVHNSPAVPSPPRGLTGVPGKGSLALVFSPPASDGGSPITSYQAQCAPGNIVVSAASTPIRISGLANNTSYDCTVTAVNALGAGDPAPPVTVTPGLSVPDALVGVASRKNHGAAGTFGVSINWNYPISGVLSIEPRTSTVAHEIVFQFNNDAHSVGTPILADAASVPFGQATPTIAGNDVVVVLGGVSDRQIATVSIPNINGALNVSATIGFLAGDVSGSRSVNAADISAAKANSGSTPTAANFRLDMNASGQIDSADVSAIKMRSGLSLP